MTSHDVVDIIRRATGIRRIGHTGTLDPAATGLLILCVGPATRLSEFLTGLDKTYEGALLLGVTTDSYDMDGRVLAEHAVPDTSLEGLQTLCNRFTGEILQVPPMVSAVKVGGERLYKLARKGETVEREPRPVTVREFTVLSYEPPQATFRLCCTRGTYARSLCHDVGQLLGCGGCLASLRRTAVGRYSIGDAMPVLSFNSPDKVKSRLLPLNTALDLPEAVVRHARQGLVLSGCALENRDLRADCPIEEGWIQVKSESGELLALGMVESPGGFARIQPKRVLSGP
ncbi:MAG: tRNA pseudouridine(55) synthase TruB [Candidatus Hydrogenedentes bacterium]|nr:tRNA pseudouridine(55) synthase TruB [Candidatus Hydrogenedentota bacterium]